VKKRLPAKGRSRLTEYLIGFAAVAVSTALSGLLSPYLPLSDLDMITLLGLVAVSTQLGLAPSLFTAALTALSFDFFFIPPVFRFDPGDLKGAVTLTVMTVVAGVISALGERSRRQQAAARARDLQIETERLRSSLLSAVSHDLRTPLAAIFGAGTELLRDGARLDQPSRQELVSAIVEESERLNQLVTNLLDVARLDGGAIEVKKRPEALEEVVETALGRVRGRLGTRVVRTHIPVEVPLIPMDSVLLEQVFVNLLENAIRYTPEASPVEIEARALGGEVLVEVRDEGPGVSENERERLFERFVRGAGRQNDGGVGLGLTICRAIVDAHGGSIEIANREARGAVVRLRLPLSGPVAPASTEEFREA
jgi:two-component system sensor histidine kinase KdpD